jgi:hypothetical protein
MAAVWEAVTLLAGVEGADFAASPALALRSSILFA